MAIAHHKAKGKESSQQSKQSSQSRTHATRKENFVL
jgi:hypothetical protein